MGHFLLIFLHLLAHVQTRLQIQGDEHLGMEAYEPISRVGFLVYSLHISDMLILNLTTNIAKSHNNYMHQQKLLNLTTKITKSYNNYLHQQKLLNLTTKITKSNNNHTSKLYSRKVLNPTTKITKSHNKYY